MADKVGLSQAGLLHHFPSKEHLLQAVLTWRDGVSARLIGEPLPEGIDLLRGLVALAEYNASTPELVELHVIVSAEGTSEDHPLRDYFVEPLRLRSSTWFARRSSGRPPRASCGRASTAPAPRGHS